MRLSASSSIGVLEARDEPSGASCAIAGAATTPNWTRQANAVALVRRISAPPTVTSRPPCTTGTSLHRASPALREPRPLQRAAPDPRCRMLSPTLIEYKAETPQLCHRESSSRTGQNEQIAGK